MFLHSYSLNMQPWWQTANPFKLTAWHHNACDTWLVSISLVWVAIISICFDISYWLLTTCMNTCFSFTMSCPFPKFIMGLFTKEWITFWKPFQIAVRFLIWTICVHKHCNRRPNHNHDLHTAREDFVPTAQIDPCISKVCTQESRSERALRSHVLRIRLVRQITTPKCPFCALQKPDLKELCVHKGKIRLSNQERVRITIWYGFQNVITLFVNRPYMLYGNALVSIYWSQPIQRRKC